MTLPKWLKKPSEPLHLIDYFQVCDALSVAVEAIQAHHHAAFRGRYKTNDKCTLCNALSQIEKLGEK